MSFHIVIVSLIATALTMCVVSLIGDAVAYYAGRRNQRLVAARAAEYPHPIPQQYPVERPAHDEYAGALYRTPRAQAQWRVSGAAMSEMSAVFSQLDSHQEMTRPRARSMRA